MRLFRVSGGNQSESLDVSKGPPFDHVYLGKHQYNGGWYPARVKVHEGFRSPEAIYEAHPKVYDNGNVVLYPMFEGSNEPEALLLLDEDPGLRGQIEVTSATKSKGSCPNRKRNLGIRGRCGDCGEPVDRIHPDSGESDQFDQLKLGEEVRGIKLLMVGSLKHQEVDEEPYSFYPTFLVSLKPTSLVPDAAIRIYKSGNGNHEFVFVQWDGEELRVGSSLDAPSTNGTNGQTSKPGKKSKKLVTA